MQKGRNVAGKIPGGVMGGLASNEIEDALTLEEFRSVYRSGGFRAVGLVGVDAGFAIWARTASNTRVRLVTTRSRMRRLFATPVMAFKLLQDMGILEFQVELQNWYPRMEQTYFLRNDVSNRMVQLHRVGKKQMEFEEAHAVPVDPVAQYEEAARIHEEWQRKIAERKAREASGLRMFVDSEGDAWMWNGRMPGCRSSASGESGRRQSDVLESALLGV